MNKQRFFKRKCSFLKNISIHLKIFLFLLGFCGVLLILLWLFQVVFLDRFYKSIKVNEIRATAKLIEKNIDDDSKSLDALIQAISSQNNMCIELLSDTGEVLYSADVLKECSIHRFPSTEINALYLKALESETPLLDFFNLKKNGDFQEFSAENFVPREIHYEKTPMESLVYTHIIKDAQGNARLLLLNSVITPVNATVTTLRVQLYYITGFMLLFSIFLAFLIAKRVSKPIVALNNTAKDLSTGNYEVLFNASGYKEINELCDTLNHTAKELSKVEGLRQDLIANISHDLRTPLTLISGYAEAMRDLPDENNAENAQIIVDETTRLTTLVNNVLDISKIQSGEKPLHKAPYAFTKSIKNTICRMNKLLKKEGYLISFTQDKFLSISGDEAQISQAFYNLLINAVNYTGEDQQIFIAQEIFQESGVPWVKISITDTGEGIAKEDFPYIWDRYYKVDKTHRRGITGTGIGLSIVKSIIAKHSGTYGVSSQLGKGSTFWFALKLDP